MRSAKIVYLDGTKPEQIAKLLNDEIKTIEDAGNGVDGINIMKACSREFAMIYIMKPDPMKE